MINIDGKWNFATDELAWKELISKSFSTLSTFSIKTDFHYNLDQSWPKTTLFNENKKNNDIVLALLGSGVTLSKVKEYNIQKILTQKNLSSYHCNSDKYNQMGHDGRWEIVIALYDLVVLWQKNKLPKVINVLSSIDENIFYQQIKVLSFKLVLEHLLTILKVKSQINLDLIVSDKMYNNTDPKNNLIRLSYAMFSAIMLDPAKIILRPITGIAGANSWKLAAHTFNILTFETDLLANKNAFCGAPFFENSVKQFSQSIWEGLQYLFKLEDDKKRKNFITNLSSARKKALEKHIEQRDIKVVGVNEFIAPIAKSTDKKNNSNVNFIEKKRLVYIKKFSKLLQAVNFNFAGEQNKLSQRLNEIYQMFAILNVNVTWKKVDLKSLNVKSKSSEVYVVSSEEQTQALMQSWKNVKDILIIFENENIIVCYKNKVHAFLYHKNPFLVLENLVQVIQ